MLRFSNKKFFSFLLLLLFLSVNKGFGFHHLTHECEEEQKECGVCEVVIHNELSEVIELPQIELCTINYLPSFSEIQYKEHSIPYITTISYKSRPPPAGLN